MKRFHTLLLLLFTFLTLATPSRADGFEADGIYYNIIEGTNQVAVKSSGYTDIQYSGSVVIPSTVTHEGTTYTVTSIGQAAFSACPELTSVTIPNSVTTIGKQAFWSCTGLTSVTIPNSVTSIGNAAFNGCSGLTSVTIGNSVTSMEFGAFYGCSGLTSVTIPNSVTSIGGQTFYNCTDLTSVTIGEGVTSIGMQAFSGCRSLTSVTIPNSVTSIENQAFQNCSGLTSVTIGEGVTSIKNSAFSGCSSLMSVTIGEGVTSIGNYAFSDCSGLTSVEWNAINCQDFNSNNRPFYDCEKITAFTFGDKVEHIPAYLCFGCSGLESVTIPNGVTSIGNYAFYNCSGLTSVEWNAINCGDFASHSNPFSSAALTSITFGDKVEHFPAYLCYNQSSLTSVEWNAINCQDLTSSQLPSTLASITFGDKVEHIPNLLCFGCSGLTSVTIGESVTSIGGWAFESCSSLTSVKWNAINCLDFTVSPFSSAALTSITFGSEVAHLPNYLCYNQSNLTSITIPNSVTSIGSSAFFNCSGLTSVTIPNSVTSIETQTFCNCIGLTSMTIPNSVTSIESQAFYQCSGLTSVTIGEGVTSIGNSAFSGCSGLTEVTSLAETPPSYGSNAFTTRDKLYVPCGSKAAYEGATGWSSFNEIIGLACPVECDTIRFSVRPSTASGATNTLQYGHLHDILKMEWVSGENREEIPFPGGSCTQEITTAGEVYIYYPRESQYAVLLNTAILNTNPHYILINTNDVILDTLDVSGCTSLKTLDCSNKQLTSLNVSGCTAMEKLECQNNQLTALNVSGCAALTTLYCANNQLTALNVSGCAALTTLYCANNQLTALNVSGCAALTNLRCENNQLTALDVSGCTALTDLQCYENQLASLDVNDCTALKTLFCHYNQLSTLDVSNNTALTNLRCNNNQLMTLNVSPNTMILWCQNNHISLSTLHSIYTQRESWSTFSANNQTDTVILSACQPLNLATEKTLGGATTTYTLRNTSYQDVSPDVYMEDDFSFKFNEPFKGKLKLQNANLPDVSMTYCITAEECSVEPPTPPTTITDTLYFEFALTEWASSAEIEYNFPSAMLPGVKMEYNDGQAHDKFTPDAYGNITVNGNGHGWIYYTHEPGDTYSASFEPLEESAESLQNESIRRDAKGKMTIAASPDYVRFTSLDVSSCTALTELGCGSNQLTKFQLTSLDVSGCTALTTLRCNNNQLTSLDVSGCTALTELYCNGNQLTSLDVSGCTALEGLNCHDNQLSALDVSVCTALTSLVCSKNQLTELDMSANTALTYLQCYENRLTTLDVSSCTVLNNLQCQDNELTVLDLGDNTSLTTLYCYNNHLPLSTLYNIYTQREDWYNFSANPQTDTLTVLSCRPWDLSSEGMLGETATTYVLKDEEGNEVPAGAYNENGFVFQLNAPFKGTLTLQNQDFKDKDIRNRNEVITMTYHVTVSECFTVVVVSNNEAWGLATKMGNGTYEKDSSVTIIATPREGYRFVNWTKGGEVFSIYAVYSFAVTEDIALVANFEKVPDLPVVEGFTVDLSVNNPEWGRVFKTGNCVYGEGDEITILALPFAGYRFVNWTKEDGSVFGTDSLVVFKVTENLELVANFEELPVPPVPVRDSFSVQVFSNNEAWGTVSQSGEGRYEKDSLVTITATPVAGYRFVGWTRDDAVFCGQADTTFAVTEDMELTAHFEKIPDETKPNDGFYIYVKDGVIHLSQDRGRVEVFNAIGQCLYRGRTTTLRVRQTGVYLICIADKTYKVLVM